MRHLLKYFTGKVNISNSLYFIFHKYKILRDIVEMTLPISFENFYDKMVKLKLPSISYDVCKNDKIICYRISVNTHEIHKSPFEYIDSLINLH